MLREYRKYHCKTRGDALHCNNYLYNRDGVECPCLLYETEHIKDGDRFLYNSETKTVKTV